MKVINKNKDYLSHLLAMRCYLTMLFNEVLVHKIGKRLCRQEEGSELLLIGGMVVSASNGKGLEGVGIRVDGKSELRYTHQDGFYLLSLAQPSGSISFSKEGYQSYTCSYKEGENMLIKLKVEGAKSD